MAYEQIWGLVATSGMGFLWYIHSSAVLVQRAAQDARTIEFNVPKKAF